MIRIKNFKDFRLDKLQITNENWWSKLTGRDKRRKEEIDKLTKSILQTYKSARDSNDKELVYVYKKEFIRILDMNSRIKGKSHILKKMLDDSDNWFGEDFINMDKQEYEKFTDVLKFIEEKIKPPSISLDEISTKIKNGKKLKKIESDIISKLEELKEYHGKIKKFIYPESSLTYTVNMKSYKEECGNDFNIKFKDLKIVKDIESYNKERNNFFIGEDSDINKIKISIKDLIKSHDKIEELYDVSTRYNDINELSYVLYDLRLSEKINELESYLKETEEKFIKSNERESYKKYKSFIEKNSDKTWIEYKYDIEKKFSMKSHIEIYKDEYVYLGTCIKDYEKYWKDLIKGRNPDGSSKYDSGGYGIWMAPTIKEAAQYPFMRLKQLSSQDGSRVTSNSDAEEIINSGYYPTIYKIKIDENSYLQYESDTNMEKDEYEYLNLLGLAGTHSGMNKVSGGGTVEICIINEKHIKEVTKLSDKEILNMKDNFYKKHFVNFINQKNSIKQ